MSLRFLSPFHSTVAELKVTRGRASWVTAEGESNLASHPEWKKWITPRWWEEMGFLFGMLSPESGKHSQMNLNGQPIKYERADRKIECRYNDASEKYPAFCSLEDRDLRLRFDFSSVDCRSTL